MKGIMKGQVKNLTSNDIKLIADFIDKPEVVVETNAIEKLDSVCIVKITADADAGKTSYKKCVGCHGAKGNKKALGKSKIISQMTKKDVAEALIGYREGIYGSSMKGLMISQIKGLSEQDLINIAEYIGQ
jgi:cytochrome c553